MKKKIKIIFSVISLIIIVLLWDYFAPEKISSGSNSPLLSIDIDYTKEVINGVDRDVLLELHKRKKLYANNITIHITFEILKSISSDEKFKVAIEHFANKKDWFALLVKAMQQDAIKPIADAGNPQFQYFYSLPSHSNGDKQENINYLVKAANNGLLLATQALLILYDVDEYGCDVLQSAYSRHSIESFTPFFITGMAKDNISIKKFAKIQEKCAIFPVNYHEEYEDYPLAVLQSVKTPVAEYMIAVREYVFGDFDEAVRMLKALESTDDKRLQSNIFACLGLILHNDDYKLRAFNSGYYYPTLETYYSPTTRFTKMSFTNMGIFCNKYSVEDVRLLHEGECR
jgi:hypothetical protein